MLRKLFVIGFCLVLLSFVDVTAQRFAYVNTEYILQKMPEYKAAQEKLDQLTKRWKEEIQKRVKEIDKLYNNYQAEKALLPEKEKQKREEKIARKEEALKKFKEEKFGEEGELYQKRKELIKPIQDRVFNKVQKLAKEQSLDFVFDKSGAVTMLYTNAKYNRSDKVLKMLGVDVNESKEKSGESEKDERR